MIKYLYKVHFAIDDDSTASHLFSTFEVNSFTSTCFQQFYHFLINAEILVKLE